MIYLNNASTGYPKPQTVIDAVLNNLNSPPYNYGRSGLSRGNKNIVNDTRKLISDFFNAGSDYYTVFTSGSTESLNLAIKGIDLSGKHVIISSTEHNSVIRPLMSQIKKDNFEISIAECDSMGFVEPANISKYIQHNTALVCINHCSNVTGTIQDISEISRICKEKNILLLVDASQSAGLIDISVDDISPDFLCFTGHKSLNSLQGIGGLIFKKSINLNPLKEGGTGTMSNLLEQPENFPAKYESGTLNLPAISALEAGINWIKEVGISKIRSHKKLMIDIVINEIKNINGIKLFYDESKSSGAILSLTIDGIETEEINFILSNSFDISVRSGIHCAPLIHKYLGTENGGTLRISPSYFTTINEIEKFIDSFKKIVNKFRE